MLVREVPKIIAWRSSKTGRNPPPSSSKQGVPSAIAAKTASSDGSAITQSVMTRSSFRAVNMAATAPNPSRGNE